MTMTARTCKHEGCALPARARGMCPTHWKHWRKANPDVNYFRATENTVLASMPGTLAELEAKTGLCQQSVRRALKALREGGDQARAHVGDHKAPTSKGTKFQPIYVAGPGEDAVLSKLMKDAQRRKSNRQSHALRTTKKKVAKLGASASWAAALFTG